MPSKPIKPKQYAFIKDHDETYFALLRLACVTKCSHSIVSDPKEVIATLNKISLFADVHKRIIPLLNDKAHKLNVFNDLSEESQKILTLTTQQGIVTELAKNMQLNNIIAKLAEYNIPLILLKGAAFAGVLYSAQAPRTSNDLDILIQKKDWQKAVSIINVLMTYTEKPQPGVFGDLYELSFVPKNKVGAALDLHSSLVHPSLFDIKQEQLWDLSVKHPNFNNELVRMLSPEHALIHQALHAYKDMHFGKYNLVDCHEIIEGQKADLNKTINIATNWGAGTPLYVILKNCAELMGSDIKSDQLKQIEPNLFTHKIITKLLNSKFTNYATNTKPLRYRINQIVAQFAFTNSVIRPITLQCLFLKSLFALKKDSK